MIDNLTPLKSRGLTWLRADDAVNAGIVILHKVTSGKTYYLIAASLMILHYAAGNHLGYIRLRDGADTRKATVMYLACADAEEARGNSIPFPIPLEVPADWDIYIEANTATTALGSIIGWEE